MNNIFSILIRNNTDERIHFLKIKFCLELSGYAVLEEELKIAEELNNSCICIPEDKSGGVSENYYELVNNLIDQQLFVTDGEIGENRIGVSTYEKNIFPALYTICYLCANRRARYNDCEILKSAAKTLIGYCTIFEGFINKGQELNWRFYYAYLYLANRVNEAMLKIGAYQYCSCSELAIWINRVRRLSPNNEGIQLLEAEIYRNDTVLSASANKLYQRLVDNSSCAIKYWSYYALGEMAQEVSDRRLEDSDIPKGEAEKSEFNEDPIKLWRKAADIKEDEVRLIYKFALQHERKGNADKQELETAAELYQKAVRIIESKKISNRTTLEFEYLYKCHIRLGWVYQLMLNYKNAKEQYQESRSCWDELEEYSLIDSIYGEDADNVRNFLENKYKDREITYELNMSEIRRNLQG